MIFTNEGKRSNVASPEISTEIISRAVDFERIFKKKYITRYFKFEAVKFFFKPQDLRKPEI